MVMMVMIIMMIIIIIIMTTTIWSPGDRGGSLNERVWQCLTGHEAPQTQIFMIPIEDEQQETKPLNSIASACTPFPSFWKHYTWQYQIKLTFNGSEHRLHRNSTRKPIPPITKLKSDRNKRLTIYKEHRGRAGQGRAGLALMYVRNGRQQNYIERVFEIYGTQLSQKFSTKEGNSLHILTVAVRRQRRWQ